MYHISQEKKDELFRGWIAQQNHRLEILHLYGFDRSQGIEMLKVLMLDSIEEMLRYLSLIHI